MNIFSNVFLSPVQRFTLDVADESNKLIQPDFVNTGKI